MLKEQLLKVVNSFGNEAEGAEDVRRWQVTVVTSLIQCLEEKGLVSQEEVMRRVPKLSSEMDQLFAERRDQAKRDESPDDSD